MSWSRRELLWSGGLLGALGCGRGPDPVVVGPARNVVVVMVDGGWDPTFALDPKLGIAGVVGPTAESPQSTDDREDTGRWGPLEIAVNPARRPAVTTFFDRWAPRTTVVRGLWVGSVSHWIGRRRILTGRDDRQATDWITQVGAERRDDRPLGIVDLSGHARFGDASATSLRAGRRGQLGQLLLPHRRMAMGDGSSRPSLLRQPGDDPAIDEWLSTQARQDPRRDLGRSWLQALDGRTEARTRAASLLAEVPNWSPSLSGTQGALGGQIDLAIALLQHRIARTILVDSGHSWDTHADHGRQHGWHQSLFSSIGQLVSGLHAQGLLDETLVVVLSEMGRTGWRNQEDGTEHWPYTSALLVGADIEGPHLIGATDDELVGRPVDVERGLLDPNGAPLRYDQFVAGIIAMAGVDPAWILPDVVPLRGLTGPS
ncbi:MAG: DUF1501 domain-containing protein [Myxococcota bacterium]